MSRRTAIVTGGSRGIGYGIVKQLREDGCRVAILDVNDPEEYKSELLALGAAGKDWAYYKGSIASAEDRRDFVAQTVDMWGDIDVLVNNAGVAPKIRRDMMEMTEESFDFVMDIVLKGTMFMTQEVARRMLAQPMKGKKRATIVFITSSNVTVSSPYRAEYCMAKAGLSALSRVYADRLARARILVHEVRPGIIETEMTRVVHEKYSKTIEEGDYPITRWGTPEDVALAVSALASDKFLYTTGNYIDVDGGFHIQTHDKKERLQ